MEQSQTQRGGEGTAIEWRGDLKAWLMSTADLARTRIGSSKVTAQANLVYPSRKAARKIAAPLARKNGSHNAQSHRRAWTH
jgi:hypothetical protein